MLSNNEIVEFIYKTIDVKRLIRMYCKSNGNIAISDFEQTIYLILLEYDNEKMNIIYDQNKLYHFLVGIIRNQNMDPYSVYNKHHKPLKIDWYKYITELEIERDQELLNDVEEVVKTYRDENDWFFKKLLDVYITHNETYRSISKKVGYELKTTYNYIKKSKMICKEELEKKLSNK